MNMCACVWLCAMRVGGQFGVGGGVDGLRCEYVHLCVWVHLCISDDVSISLVCQLVPACLCAKQTAAHKHPPYSLK